MVGKTFDITGGMYAGKRCTVTLVHSLYPTFAQVVILNMDGSRSKTSDMIPCAYLTPHTGSVPHVSKVKTSGSNGTT